MNAVDKLPLSTLLQETALRWRLAGTACPECHAALYTHQALGPLGMGYHRCPACHLNFVQRDSVMHLDRMTDQLLDRAARETPLISHPVRTVGKHDPVTGAVDPCAEPAPWKG